MSRAKIGVSTAKNPLNKRITVTNELGFIKYFIFLIELYYQLQIGLSPPWAVAFKFHHEKFMSHFPFIYSFDRMQVQHARPIIFSGKYNTFQGILVLKCP